MQACIRQHLLALIIAVTVRAQPRCSCGALNEINRLMTAVLTHTSTATLEDTTTLLFLFIKLPIELRVELSAC
jgi:hypothetical protein